MATEFGKFLKVVRINQGENAKQMAQKLGLSPSYLSSIESGKRNVPTSMESKIVQAYHFSAEERKQLRKSMLSCKKVKRLNMDGISARAKSIIMLLSKCSLDQSLLAEMEMLLMERNTDKEVQEDLYSLGKLVEFLPVGVGIYRIEQDGVYPMFVSPKACEYLGFCFDEYQQRIKQHMKVFSSEVADFILEASQKDTQKATEKTFCTQHINGKEVWLRFLVNFSIHNKKKTCYATIVDTTEMVKKKQVYNEQKEIYDLLLKEIDMLVFKYDIKKDNMFISLKMPDQAKENIFVKNYKQLLPNSKYIHPDFTKIVSDAFLECERVNSPTKEVYYQANYDGNGFLWYRAILKPVTDQDGKIYMIVGKSENCNEEIEKNMRLKIKAELDFNTNLLNRSTTEEKTNHLLKTASPQTPMAFVEFDVDDFKLYNDKYGHLVGDEVLHHLGAVTLKSLEEDEIAGRAGGDEFVLLLRHNIDKDSISLTCKELVAELDSRVTDIGIEENPTISFGCVIIDKPTDFVSALECADKAMYKAKRTGKNRIVFY